MASIGQEVSSTLAVSITPSKPGVYAISGAATTYSVGDIQYFINGKAYLKAAATGETTPTTDSAGAVLENGTTAGLSLATGYGTVVVWGVNAAGTVSIYRGETVALDSSNAFSRAPRFPSIPEGICPVTYTTHINYSGSAFVIGTTNWNTGSTVHATQAIGFLPSRPQVA
jgi:hypothetical protein